MLSFSYLFTTCALAVDTHDKDAIPLGVKEHLYGRRWDRSAMLEKMNPAAAVLAVSVVTYARAAASANAVQYHVSSAHQKPKRP